MSTMIVDRVQQEEKLASILGAINDVSIPEEPLEKRINRFLDSINDKKRYLQKQATGISELLPKIEEISWFRGLDEPRLVHMKEIIDLMNRLCNKMIRIYAETNKSFTQNGIDKTELKFYKEVTDELKERAVDLYDIFFVIPNDEEFQDLCEELNDL